MRILVKTGVEKSHFFSANWIYSELLGITGNVYGVYFVKNEHTILFFYLPSPVQFLFNRESNGPLGLVFN